MIIKLKNKGFTLVEVILASAILAIVSLGVIYLISEHGIIKQKAKDEAIMMSFAKQYIEILRNKDYRDIKYNTAINTLYDGAHNSPQIKVPVNGTTWVSLLTTNYLTFHPDLQWFVGRSPQLRCEIIDFPAAPLSNITKKHIRVDLRWDPPLNRGKKQTLRFDTIVYTDFK